MSKKQPQKERAIGAKALNPTEKKIKEALLCNWAGPLLGGRGSFFSACAIAGLNGRSVAQVEKEAEDGARKIYNSVNRKRRKCKS